MSRRVQVRPLAPPERLRPPAPVRVEMARPAQPIINNDLANLADALGSFGQGAQRLVGRVEDSREEDQQNALDAAIASIGRETDPEVRAELFSDLREQGVWDGPAVAAINTQMTQASFQTWENDFNARIQAGEIDLTDPELDIDALVQEELAPIYSEIADDPNAMAALNRSAQALRQSLHESQQEVAETQAQRLVIDTARLRMTDVLNLGVNSFDSPEAFMGRVQDVYDELGPRSRGGSLDLDYQVLDRVLLGVLGEQAQNPNLVDFILDALDQQRFDHHGNPLPSLASTPRVATIAQRVRDVATETGSLNWRRTFAGTTEASDIAQFTSQRVFDFQDLQARDPYTGETFTLSGEDRLQYAINGSLRRSRERAQAKGQPFNLDEEFNLTIRRGLEHPTMVADIERAFLTAANTEAMQDPEAQSSLAMAANLYDYLSSRNRAAIDEGLTRDQMAFFDAYHLGRHYMGLSDTQALSQAIRVSDPNATTALGGEAINGVHRAVEQLTQGGIVGIGGQEIRNPQVVRNTLTRISRVYTALGQTPEQAVETAAQSLRDSGAFVNGNFIMAPGVTSEMGEVIEGILERQFNAHPAEMAALGIEDHTQLSVYPAFGTGVLGVTTADGRMISVTIGRQPMLLQLSDIAQTMEALEQQESVAQQQQVLQEQARRASDALERQQDAATRGDRRRSTQDAQGVGFQDFLNDISISTEEAERREMRIQEEEMRTYEADVEHNRRQQETPERRPRGSRR